MTAFASKKQIIEQIESLLASEEGIMVLLSGGLMISDFDDPELAYEEALKAFQGNKAYFQRLILAAEKRK